MAIVTTIEISDDEIKRACRGCYSPEPSVIRSEYANLPEYMRRYVVLVEKKLLAAEEYFKEEKKKMLLRKKK